VIHHIKNLDLPELQPYRTLRRPEQHKQQGIFVAEGSKVVERLLQSGLTIVSMLLTPTWCEKLFAGNPPSYDLYLAEKKLLESIVGFPLHQGVMAVARVPTESSLPDALPRFEHPFLFVAMDGIASAENVGVIVRNASAFGATAILSGETSGSPYLRRAVRNSMGAVFCMPVFHSTNIVEDIRMLQGSWRTTVVGADPSGMLSIHETDFTSDICVVFGNEGDGLSGAVKNACDLLVSIPMLNQTDSLNVSAASATFLYQARRSRLEAGVINR
jgi:tRNA G18 (ribose-2'-O)-methylase SpoU